MATISEIQRKLKQFNTFASESDDPAAYGKWDADYIDKAKTKKYKTRKSTSTTAYEKRFGKKEK